MINLATPQIDADFIAQYQINYGATQSHDQSAWDKLTDEEKQKQYDEYWSNYYQAYTKEQPKMPKFKIDEEGYEVEIDLEEEREEERKKAKEKEKDGDKKSKDEKKQKSEKTSKETEAENEGKCDIIYNLDADF